MGILGILALLAGCCVAGALGYIVACRCDKRSRDRDLYREQLRLAAKKLGDGGFLALCEEEINCPSDKELIDSTPDPDGWKMGTLRYSPYAIIPRPIIHTLSISQKARLLRILGEIDQSIWHSDTNGQYVVTMREWTGKRRYVKDPLLA
jgi:hypothetical protein